MTGFDVSMFYERMGEILSRMGGQDKAIAAVDAKVDRNLHQMEASRDDAAVARQATALLAQRVDDLRQDHAKLDKRMGDVAGRVSDINAAAGVARAMLNWKPMAAAVLGLGLLLKDWIAKKLGL